MKCWAKADAQQPRVLICGCGVEGPGAKGFGNLVGLMLVVSWAWLGQVIVNIMGASPCGLFWSFSPMRTVTKLDCKHVQPGLQKTLIIELLDINNKNVPHP